MKITISSARHITLPLYDKTLIVKEADETSPSIFDIDRNRYDLIFTAPIETITVSHA